MNFATLDLNLLKVFDAMMREGSTTRAGQRIGLSQPAVSAALGRLRHALGDELFVRHGQGVVPTDYARAVETPIRETLERLEALLHRKPFDPAQSDAVLRFSALDFMSEMLVPRLMEILRRDAPGMRLQHLDLVPDNYIEMLDAQSLDMALLPALKVPEWVETRPLFRSPFALIARRGHSRLARAGLDSGDTIPLDLFCDLDHGLCSPDGKLRAMTDDALDRLGRQRRVVLSTPFFAGLIRVVRESDVIAMIPGQLARAVAKREGLALYAAPLEMPCPLIVMHWHRRSSGNPAQGWFRDRVAEILGALHPPGMAL